MAERKSWSEMHENAFEKDGMASKCEVNARNVGIRSWHGLDLRTSICCASEIGNPSDEMLRGLEGKECGVRESRLR